MTITTGLGYSCWTELVVGEPNRERFCVRWNNPDWNAASIQCVMPPILNKAGRTRTALLERIDLFVVSTAAGVIFADPTISTPDQGGVRTGIPPWTTTAVKDTRIWELFVPMRVSVDPLTWINWGDISNYAATDDAYTTAWGYIEWEPLEQHGQQASPLPVSVEGYKWPLTRRL